jgi:hypothetical protein
MASIDKTEPSLGGLYPENTPQEKLNHNSDETPRTSPTKHVETSDSPVVASSSLQGHEDEKIQKDTASEHVSIATQMPKGKVALLLTGLLVRLSLSICTFDYL